jgi:hypothetical protein
MSRLRKPLTDYTYTNRLDHSDSDGRPIGHITYKNINKYFYISSGGGNEKFNNKYRGVYNPIYGKDLDANVLIKSDTLLRGYEFTEGRDSSRKWLQYNSYREYDISLQQHNSTWITPEDKEFGFQLYIYISFYILYEEDLFISYVSSIESEFWNDKRVQMEKLYKLFRDRNGPAASREAMELAEVREINFPITDIPYISNDAIEMEMILYRDAHLRNGFYNIIKMGRVKTARLLDEEYRFFLDTPTVFDHRLLQETKEEGEEEKTPGAAPVPPPAVAVPPSIRRSPRIQQQKRGGSIKRSRSKCRIKKRIKRKYRTKKSIKKSNGITEGARQQGRAPTTLCEWASQVAAQCSQHGALINSGVLSRKRLAPRTRTHGRKRKKSIRKHKH